MVFDSLATGVEARCFVVNAVEFEEDETDDDFATAPTGLDDRNKGSVGELATVLLVISRRKMDIGSLAVFFLFGIWIFANANPNSTTFSSADSRAWLSSTRKYFPWAALILLSAQTLPPIRTG